MQYRVKEQVHVVVSANEQKWPFRLFVCLEEVGEGVPTPDSCVPQEATDD